MKLRLRVLALVAAIGACGDESPAGPSPGALEVRLNGPAGVGAALLLVEGGAIDSVEAAGYYTASAPYSGVARKVLVVGQGLQGTLVRIAVPDRRVEYRATILELADGATYQLLAPQAFTVTVEK
jgi:hypothetical protein